MPGKTSIIMGVHSLQCTEKRPGGSVCAQLCPTLWNPMNCSPPGSSVHGSFQARILEWVAGSFSGDLSDPGMEPTSLASPALPGELFYH